VKASTGRKMRVTRGGGDQPIAVPGVAGPRKVGPRRGGLPKGGFSRRVGAKGVRSARRQGRLIDAFRGCDQTLDGNEGNGLRRQKSVDEAGPGPGRPLGPASIGPRMSSVMASSKATRSPVDPKRRQLVHSGGKPAPR